jgi:hypothetical protein
MKEAHVNIYTALKDIEGMLENIEENASQIARCKLYNETT